MLNTEGIELLKADMRANANAYKQETFGHRVRDMTDSDNTLVLCMAGFCLIRKVGQTAFENMLIKDGFFAEKAVKAGIEQLGIIPIKKMVPCIFNYVEYWPQDLRARYNEAITQQERVEVAWAALDRLRIDGSIN